MIHFIFIKLTMMSFSGIENVSTMRVFVLVLLFVLCGVFCTIVSMYDHVFLKLGPGQVGWPETLDDLIWRCCYALYSLCCTVSLCLSICCGVLMFFVVLFSFYFMYSVYIDVDSCGGHGRYQCLPLLLCSLCFWASIPLNLELTG